MTPTRLPAPGAVCSKRGSRLRTRTRTWTLPRTPSPTTTTTPGTLADTIRRDRLDSGRADSPLAIAPGAIVINTDHIGLEQTVAAVVSAIMTATRRR